MSSSVGWILECINSEQVDLIRVALQNIFWNACKNNRISERDFPYSRLESLIKSRDSKIRKWAYYVSCFYRNKQILNILKNDIKDEEDELIRSWMFAVAYRSSDEVYKYLKTRVDVGLSENTITLLENLFKRSSVKSVDKFFIERVLSNESMIDKCWLTFYYKYRYEISNYLEKEAVAIEYITALISQSHETNSDENSALAQVEEYALSALCYYSPNFSFFNSVRFGEDGRGKVEDEIKKMRLGPRKWAYTLIWKDPCFVKENLDFVKELMPAQVLGSKDREGLAKGLLDYYDYNKDLERDILDWYSLEYGMGDNILCETYLFLYMQKHQEKSPEFKNQVKENRKNRENGESGDNAGGISTIETKTINRKVFIVHRYGDLFKDAVARFIESIGLEPVILQEQADKGQTNIEKVEGFTDEASYAIVLYTPCDHEGQIGCNNLHDRARLNVAFEHGLLIGKLGRSRVCLLVKGDVEKPSDTDGVLHIPANNEKEWKLSVAKELQAAGYEVDFNLIRL